ncbi:hypothetical protein [Paenibacillus periandrae]|uniref:hypothetical protein n=1 Tax=Paenibacillus periandrae TaxID=1761741 RepID=UPI001F09F874|nr:hypothetical protein [Paenibacillus periandrae]
MNENKVKEGPIPALRAYTRTSFIHPLEQKMYEIRIQKADKEFYYTNETVQSYKGMAGGTPMMTITGPQY